MNNAGEKNPLIHTTLDYWTFYLPPGTSGQKGFTTLIQQHYISWLSNVSEMSILVILCTASNETQQSIITPRSFNAAF